MRTILQNIRDWFIGKEEYLRAFAEEDSRVEGWFKAELLLLFTRLRKNGVIRDFKREYKILDSSGHRRQVDFKISLVDKHCLCELKPLCISQAAGTPRNLSFYFRDDNVGVLRDFRKLDSLSGSGKYVLAFVYPNPGQATWTKVTSSIPSLLSHWHCVTIPSDFPDFLYISLWESQ